MPELFDKNFTNVYINCYTVINLHSNSEVSAGCGKCWMPRYITLPVVDHWVVNTEEGSSEEDWSGVTLLWHLWNSKEPGQGAEWTAETGNICPRTKPVTPSSGKRPTVIESVGDMNALFKPGYLSHTTIFIKKIKKYFKKCYP